MATNTGKCKKSIKTESFTKWVQNGDLGARIAPSGSKLCSASFLVDRRVQFGICFRPKYSRMLETTKIGFSMFRNYQKHKQTKNWNITNQYWDRFWKGNHNLDAIDTRLDHHITIFKSNWIKISIINCHGQSICFMHRWVWPIGYWIIEETSHKNRNTSSQKCIGGLPGATARSGGWAKIHRIRTISGLHTMGSWPQCETSTRHMYVYIYIYP